MKTLVDISSKLQKIGVWTSSIECNYGYLEVFRNFLVKCFQKLLNFLND